VLPRSSKPPALGALALMLALAGCSGDSGTPSAPPAPAGPPAKAAPAGPPAKAAQAAPPPAAVYAYEAKGRPDPFKPLIMPKIEKPRVVTKPKTGRDALSVNELKLAGIVWDRRGYFALVEAPNGAGYVLRVNDTVGEDTKVTKITPEGVTFEIKTDSPLPQARTRQVELQLKKEE